MRTSHERSQKHAQGKITKWKTSLLKRHAVENAQEQYARLPKTLQSAGLRGRTTWRVTRTPFRVMSNKPRLFSHQARALAIRSYSDFLSGLPTTPVKREDEEGQPLAPADRIRLVLHALIMPSDGGLGISPDAPEWDLVESVMALHERERWIHAWTTAAMSPSRGDISANALAILSPLETRAAYDRHLPRILLPSPSSQEHPSSGLRNPPLHQSTPSSAFPLHSYSPPPLTAACFAYTGIQPPVLFIVLVPRLPTVYQAITAWENHARHIAHDQDVCA
ncbi:hypothetical protein B0H12DRAFT_1223472 [Mycena haematopus]|nr:hypothetical protein B0H12DRAFT_1223472 [Mycena haematopus]